MMRSVPYTPPFMAPLRTSAARPDDGIYTCAAGRFRVPIQYRGVRTVTAVLAARLDALSPLVPAGMRLRQLRKKYGAVVVQFVEMNDTSIGGYRECVVAVACEGDDRVPSTLGPTWAPDPCFPLWLSVTSELARDSGHLVWGYPKVLLPTTFEYAAAFRGSVYDGDGPVLECTCEVPSSYTPTDIILRSFTAPEGRLVETEIRGHGLLGDGHACTVQFLGDSALSTTLRDVICSEEAIQVVCLTGFGYELPAPVACEERVHRAV